MDENYLIEKWLKDELTSAEMDAFKKLEDYPVYTNIVETSKNFKASNFSTVDSYENFKIRISEQKPVKKLHWFKPLLKVAAVFVVGISLYFSLFYNPITQIQTASTEQKTIELPDASTVTLNALTEISYSKSKWDDDREVSLNGEAFFKVAKGSVFEVITSEGSVTVMGTQFNVKQRDGYFEVKCFEGIVRVTSNNNSKKLLAGDTFRIYDSQLSFDTTSFQEPQWINNISSFKGIPLKEVLAELERQYNIEIVYDSLNLNRLFTGGFINNNLENALKSITVPMDISFKMEASNRVRLSKNSGQKQNK